jgi:hypothetical protein
VTRPTSAFRLLRGLLLVCLLDAATALPSIAQTPAPVPAPVPAAGMPRHEAEQNLVNLPTTQPLHRFGSHFRITHRFARDLRRGGLGDLASDLFGLDNGAIIGLDYRFAPMSRVQVGIYRSMLFRTIQVSGRVDAFGQDGMLPFALSLLTSVEGANNMREDHSPALGVVLSRTLGPALALYASPMFVWHSQVPSGAAVEHDHADDPSLPLEDVQPPAPDEETGYVGLGARLRLRPTTYVVLEFTPRVTGFAPGRGVWGVAIEKQTRGHIFQMNLSNSFGTTIGQTARGGEPANVYLGFNLARKF